MENSASLIDAGLTITLIGMSVVFVLLTMLVGVIHIMSTLCRRYAPMPVPVKAPATDDSELMSVIAAAVAMYRGRGR